MASAGMEWCRGSSALVFPACFLMCSNASVTEENIWSEFPVFGSDLQLQNAWKTPLWAFLMPLSTLLLFLQPWLCWHDCSEMRLKYEIHSLIKMTNYWIVFVLEWIWGDRDRHALREAAGLPDSFSLSNFFTLHSNAKSLMQTVSLCSLNRTLGNSSILFVYMYTNELFNILSDHQEAPF